MKPTAPTTPPIKVLHSGVGCMLTIVCFALLYFLTSCSPRVTRSKQIYYNNTLNYLRTRLAEHKIDSAEYKRLIDNRPELAEYFGYKPY